MPQTIQQAILYHHTGLVNGIPDKLVASVHIGDILARIMGMGNAGDNLIPEPNFKVWEVLKIPNNSFLNMRNTLMSDFEQTVRLILV